MVWARVIGSCSVLSGSVVTYLVAGNRHYGSLFSKPLAAQLTHSSDVLGEASISPCWDENWDKRDPQSMMRKKAEEEEAERPTATRRLFLIRHGQYNMSGTVDEERTLTDLGRLQAEQSAKRLFELGLEPTVIYHSTMTRATETFHAFNKTFPDVPTKSCDLLREGAPYPPQPPSKLWRPEVHFFRDGARIEAAFRKYFHRADVQQKEDSVEFIVCHGNVIRYFVCRALQLPPEAWLRISVAHCSVTQINIRPSGHVSLYSLGDVGHLLPKFITR